MPDVTVTGTFDEQTERAVRAFQQTYGLTVDGIVGRQTWNDMYRAYRGIIETNPIPSESMPLYPGSFLSLGSKGEYVTILQTWLSALADTYTDIPKITPDGNFGPLTDEAVRAFQRRFGITPNGIVGAVTWYAIQSAYEDIRG